MQEHSKSKHERQERCEHCGATDRALITFPEYNVDLCPDCFRKHSVFVEADDVSTADIEPVLARFARVWTKRGLNALDVLGLLEDRLMEATRAVFELSPDEIQDRAATFTKQGGNATLDERMHGSLE